MASVSVANLKDIGKLNVTFPFVYFTPMESVRHRTVMETSVASSDKTVDGSGLILLFESHSLLLPALVCLPCAKIYSH